MNIFYRYSLVQNPIPVQVVGNSCKNCRFFSSALQHSDLPFSNKLDTWKFLEDEWNLTRLGSASLLFSTMSSHYPCRLFPLQLPRKLLVPFYGSLLAFKSSGDTDIADILIGTLTQHRTRCFLDNCNGNNRQELLLESIKRMEDAKLSLIWFHTFSGMTAHQVSFRNVNHWGRR